MSNDEQLYKLCKDHWVEVPDYVKHATNRAMQVRALHIFAKGLEDPDHVLVKLHEEYKLIAEEQMKKEQTRKIELWEAFLHKRKQRYEADNDEENDQGHA